MNRVRQGLRRTFGLWRRSIQLRVVITSLALSGIVVTAVGWYLITQTRDGLLQHRVDSVLAETGEALQEAQQQLDAVAGTDNNAKQQQDELVSDLIERGRTRGFSVVFAGPAAKGSDLADGGADYTGGLDLASIPSGLAQQFASPEQAPAWTYTDIVTRVSTGDGSASTNERREAGVVTATQITLPASGRTYTVYLLFPLRDQQQALALVVHGLLLAALVLLALVAGLTWLVTRQVVAPVRLARRVAERLAAGRLEERLEVSGEDDLARLATSFNQMATNLQGQIRRLQDMGAMQRRFASDVSHELRTPLTTVRMASDVLFDARGRFDASSARAAELLQAELGRFENLLVDLLEISRFDAGVAQLELEPIDLGEVARRAVGSVGLAMVERGVSIEVREPDGPAWAEGDLRRVERIVRNLVGNAVDHADAGRGAPQVVVTVAADEHAAAVTVRDHGVGLRPGESALVFDRFWRADPARARTSGGTGLGLSISLEDALLHGGWLQAWGRPGDGAQFRLTLPRTAGSAVHRSPLDLEPSDARSLGTSEPPLSNQVRG